MKAYVINLDSATDRMAFQRKQLQKLEIDFQRVSAYKIDSPKKRQFLDHYDTWHRPMSIAEVSCFFSHKQIWDLIVKNNEAALILEDDAFLTNDINSIFNDLKRFSDVDYVNLETRYKRKRLISRSPSNKVGNSDLYRLYQGRSGAGGYILWPSGAKKLLTKMESEGIGLVDKFINSAYSLKSYQISPAPLIQLDQCNTYQLKAPIKTTSSISTEKTHAFKKASNAKFRYRRIMGQLKIGINKLRHFRHSVQKEIEISPSFIETSKSYND